MEKYLNSLGFDLDSLENEILLNPRYRNDDHESLYSLAVFAQESLKLQGHVWVATSGSTANNISATKLVALSKKALVASAKSANAHLKISSADIWSQVLPSFHVGGMGILVRAQISGSKVVEALLDGKWNVEHFHKVLLESKCSISSLVPTQVHDLVSGGFQAPRTLRAVVVGGGSFDLALYNKARELGWPVLPSYGMSETASQIATASLSSLKENKYPAIELLNHAQARVNNEGFIEVWAESLFTAYAQNTENGPRVWQPLGSDGWFTTEDRGAVQGNSIQVEGRGKDYIKIGGEGTNVATLRSTLEQCTLLLDAKVSSRVTLLEIPSERLGFEIHLVSQLEPAKTDLIVKLFNQKVLPFERIRKVHFVPEIPRSDLGKILWSQLRNLI